MVSRSSSSTHIRSPMCSKIHCNSVDNPLEKEWGKRSDKKHKNMEVEGLGEGLTRWCGYGNVQESRGYGGEGISR